MIITIDGPAGAGKSTIAACVAGRLGFVYINSGSLYRALTVLVIDRGIPLADSRSIAATCGDADIFVDRDGTYLEGSRVDDRLRTPDVEAAVAPVSAIPEVRARVNRLLKNIAHRQDSVTEGRDMGTVVFPQAEVKIFMDASVEARARRRHRETSDGRSMEEIRSSIEERDRLDRTKPDAPLKPATDAVILDTSHLTIDEVCARVTEICKQHIQREFHNTYE